MNTEESPSKRLKFNSQNPDKAKQNKKVNSQTTSFYTHDNSLFNNCTFSCLVILPSSCIICDFRSILKLLKAFCNAIKAYRSLYIKKMILYRIILENNIIITDSKKADSFKSILINKDLVKKIDSRCSNTQHQTGIMKFMMI